MLTIESPKVYYIENWEEQFWYSTGGTRAKKYIISPDGKFYYFKRSQFKNATENKPGKDFTFEFWSEIIAYQVGTALGFDVLRYDIAIDNDLEKGEYIVGCISESMISSEKEELIEGIRYLQGYNPAFQPENNLFRREYTFQLIVEALNKYLLSTFKEQFIAMLVFDAVIGNGDRHQENWAIIKEFSIKNIKIDISKSSTGSENPIQTYLQQILSKPDKDMYLTIGKRFAPIYDSGSSLARELTSDRVSILLKDEKALIKYINNGYSEIHWQKNKITHNALLAELLNTEYKTLVVDSIKNTINLFDIRHIEDIVNNIDNLIPDNLKQYKLPSERKKLIIKIVTLRLNILMELL